MHDELNLRRVVVALDAAADLPATIEMAASLASSLGVELRALFVEDESLRRVASMPFAQQVDAMTAARTAFNEADLDAQLKALARQARRELERIAGSHDLSWSLEIARAVIGADALSLAADELLVLAATSRPAARTLRLSSPWRRMLDQLAHPFLLVPERPATTGPMAVIYDATLAARRALDASLRIARTSKRPLIVVAPENLAGKHCSEAEARARAASPGATLRRLPTLSRQAVVELVASVGITLLVVGRDDPAGHQATGGEPVAPFSALLVL